MSSRPVAIKRDENPVFRNNGISFLSIPSSNFAKLAEFYREVFDWRVQVKAEHASLEDGTGHVIGHWEQRFRVAGEAGIIPYIYVNQLKPIIQTILSNGGQIVTSPYPEGDLTVALFKSPRKCSRNLATGPDGLVSFSDTGLREVSSQSSTNPNETLCSFWSCLLVR